VTEEHLASNYLRQRLLMWLVTGPPARQTNPIVLACARVSGTRAASSSWGCCCAAGAGPVAYLGQDVAFADLAVFVEQIHPGALVLVSMCAESAQTLIGCPQWIKQIAGRPLVTFARRAFVIQPELQKQVQGLYLGDTIQAGLSRLEECLLK